MFHERANQARLCRGYSPRFILLFALQQFSTSACVKPADYFDARSGENLLAVRGIRKFGGEVLPGEMELLVEVCAPFGAIADIIDDALKGDPFWVAAFSRAATQFHLCDDAVGDVHLRRYYTEN
jgi:hypothetical protein